MDYRDQTFENARVELDGNVYTGCSFYDCVFIFNGSAACGLNVNRYRGPLRMEFGDGAARTLRFLNDLYHSGEAGRQSVEQTFENIRQDHYYQ